MATVLTIDANDLVEEDYNLPDGERQADYHRRLYSPEEIAHRVDRAISFAKKSVTPEMGNRIGWPLNNAIVTAHGSVMAVVRWNVDALDENESAVEVIRFAEGLVPY